jgi:hypothetical protein
MSENFCKRTERRLEKVGLDKKKARRFAGFFYLSMMSVCGLMVLIPFPHGKRMAGEEDTGLLRPGLSQEGGRHGITDETPRSLRHVLAVILERMHSITGPGILCADARAVCVLSASSGLRR